MNKIIRTVQHSITRSVSSTRAVLQNPKYFTQDHEWLQLKSDGIFKVGITKHAADNLGEITYLGLDELQEMIDDEEVVDFGGSLCEIESVKSAATIGAPISGVPLKINEMLSDEDGKLMNADPENAGFLCEMKVAEFDDNELMSELAYKNYLEASK